MLLGYKQPVSACATNRARRATTKPSRDVARNFSAQVKLNHRYAATETDTKKKHCKENRSHSASQQWQNSKTGQHSKN